MSTAISFEGIDPAVLVHALYHATRPLGMGTFHNQPSLTVEQVRADLDGDERPYFDYYYGRPLKLTLNMEAKTFEPRLYDRDAGPGTAERVVASLRGAK